MPWLFAVLPQGRGSAGNFAHFPQAQVFSSTPRDKCSSPNLAGCFSMSDPVVPVTATRRKVCIGVACPREPNSAQDRRNALAQVQRSFDVVCIDADLAAVAGCRLDDPLLAEERRTLVASYTALRDAMEPRYVDRDLPVEMERLR